MQKILKKIKDHLLLELAKGKSGKVILEINLAKDGIGHINRLKIEKEKLQ